MTGWHADVGYRGEVLLILALLDFCYGLVLLAGRPPAATIATQVMPASAWGTAWLVTALLCLIGALSPSDRWVYAICVLLKCLWAGMILAYSAQHGSPGSWESAVVWLGLAALVLHASIRPEGHGGDT